MSAAAPHADDELKVTDHGPVRWIAIHRPSSKNGLTPQLNQSIIDAVTGTAALAATRCIVLTGEGGAFSSGLDFRAAAGAIMDIETVDKHLDQEFHGVIRALQASDLPVIALVDGAAVGFGSDLALACDIRVGTPRTRFGEIFVRRGLMPDGGSTFHLPRIVGLGRALDMLLTGDIIEAEEALRVGLVSRLFAVDTAVEETLAFARRVAAGPPRALRAIKRAVYTTLDKSLEDALAAERTGQLELLRSRDFVEGVSAFLDKREPHFTGE